jgi:hypothetical protein
MFASTVLDVVVGLTFLYLLLSLIVSAINEFIEARLKMRSVELYDGLRELLNDAEGTTIVKKLYTHPLVYGLFKGDFKPKEHVKKSWWHYLRGSNLPSYIPSRNFALALMDCVMPASSTARSGATGTTTPTLARTFSLEQFREAVTKVPDKHLQQALLALVDAAEDDTQQLLTNIERWYDSVMDRVSGWYKRYTQSMIFAIALVIAVFLNLDSLAIGHSLLHDKAQRDVILTAAQTYLQKLPEGTSPGDEDSITYYLDQLQNTSLPLGWQLCDAATTPTCDPTRALSPQNPWQWFAHLTHLPGWLLTAFAVTFGAPFWFDLLNKFMVIRSTVKPHEKSPEEASEDRQTPGSAAPAATSKDRQLDGLRAPEPILRPNSG